MKVTVGPSKAADIPALKALWKQAFAEEDAWIDLFFQAAYTPAGMYVVREDAEIVAMAAWFSGTLCQDRRGWPCAYLYAVATAQAARGRGYCRLLLDHMADALTETGIVGLCLLPGTAALYDFYEKLGFSRLFTHTSQVLQALPDATGQAVPADPPEYLMYREALLADTTYLSYPVPVLEYQKKAAQLCGGDLFLLSDGTHTGCACASMQDGAALLQELLWPGEAAQGAALVCRALGAQQAVLRTPGPDAPFGMIRWLTPPPALQTAYLGLAFD